MSGWDPIENERTTNTSHVHALMRMGLLTGVQQMADMYAKEDRLTFLNSQDDRGESLVLCATTRQDVRALLWLKKEGADFEVGDYRGRTPQSVAKESKNDLLLALVTNNMEEFERLYALHKAKAQKPTRYASLADIVQQERKRLIQERKQP